MFVENMKLKLIQKELSTLESLIEFWPNPFKKASRFERMWSKINGKEKRKRKKMTTTLVGLLNCEHVLD